MGCQGWPYVDFGTLNLGLVPVSVQVQIAELR